jgi:hypothetical protein
MYILHLSIIWSLVDYEVLNDAKQYKHVQFVFICSDRVCNNPSLSTKQSSARIKKPCWIFICDKQLIIK